MSNFIIKGLHRIAAQPWMYEQIQNVFGTKKLFEWLGPYFADMHNQTVLDLGGGTGHCVDRLPLTTDYICLDNDKDKLDEFKKKYPDKRAILGDATKISLEDKSVDYAICLKMSHHLTDEQFQNVLAELNRVVRKQLIFMDAVLKPGGFLNKLLWKLDRGSYPRLSKDMFSKICKHFNVIKQDSMTTIHQFILYVCEPQSASMDNVRYDNEEEDIKLEKHTL